MSESIRAYAKLGLVHHMLYGKCTNDPVYHVETLKQFAQRPDIETFDCCLPYGAEYRREAARAVKASGKTHLVFATHLFPLRKLSFCATGYAEQAQCRMIVEDMVAQAAEMGAYGFIFASGGPSYQKGSQANFDAFYDFTCWLCEKLAKHNIMAQLEPFDYDFDKAYFFGPMDRCVELVERVGKNHANIGIELDMAHLPLMREPFVGSIQMCGKWLKRVHLGNSVSKVKTDPFYGDNHPPVAYPGGNIDEPELIEILTALKDVGFLDKWNRGDLVVEMQPFPGKTVDETVADNFGRVEKAWAKVLATQPVAK